MRATYCGNADGPSPHLLSRIITIVESVSTNPRAPTEKGIIPSPGALFHALKLVDDLVGFGEGVGLHEFGSQILRPWEVVDVNLEKML